LIFEEQFTKDCAEGSGPFGLRRSFQMKVTVYRDKHDEWRWTLRAENGEPIVDSGEGYKLKGYAKCKAGKLFPDAEVVV
jgi:uncharacterized protein YegP (UPF0339 family)